MVAVRDHGRGLDAEALAHVFDRFWQKDPARAGRGGAGFGHRGRCSRRARWHGDRRQRARRGRRLYHLLALVAVVFSRGRYAPRTQSGGQRPRAA